MRRAVLEFLLDNLVWLMLIVVLFLPSVNDTKRWIRLGALSFQPAEEAGIPRSMFPPDRNLKMVRPILMRKIAILQR